MPKSFHLKQWVYVQFSTEESFTKCYIMRTVVENGFDAYEVKYENGDKEIVFTNSINRIVPCNPRKGRVIDYAKRRNRLLKLVK
jgi:hypothetical protein